MIFDMIEWKQPVQDINHSKIQTDFLTTISQMIWANETFLLDKEIFTL